MILFVCAWKVDAKPLFINCDAETIYLSDADAGKFGFPELIAEARNLKRQGVDEAETYQVLCTKFSIGNQWMLNHVMRAYHAQEAPSQCAYLPDGLKGGILWGANRIQVHACRFVEDGPVCEAIKI